MVIARRNLMSVGGAKWKNPYITDGQYVYWDAEWNNGDGTHTQEMVMMNIAGDHHHVSLPSHVELDAKSILFTSTNGIWSERSSSENALFANGWTIHQAMDLSHADACYFMSMGYNCYVRLYNKNLSRFRFVAGNSYEGYGVVADSGYFNIEGAVDKPVVFDLVVDIANSTTKLYMNGRVASSLSGGGLVGTSVVGRATFSINSQYSAPNQGSSGLRLFNFMAYTRALTAEEVATNYAVDKARFTLP